MRHNRRQHSGWSTQAKKRTEEYLGCTSCGMVRHPRHQAEPYAEPMRPLKIAGLAIWLITFYAVVIYLGLPLLEAMSHAR